MLDRIERLKDFLRESPDDGFLNHALALEYIKLGRDEEALPLLVKNTGAVPPYVAGFYQLGKVLERLGQGAQAREAYARGMVAAEKEGDRHTYNELEAAYEDLV